MGSLWANFKKWLSKTDPEGITNFDGVVCFCLPVLLSIVVLIVTICTKDNNQTTPPEKILIIREISVSTTDAGVSTTEQTTESSTGNLRNDKK